VPVGVRVNVGRSVCVAVALLVAVADGDRVLVRVAVDGGLSV
jgi:hypothetical protein